MEHFNEQDLHLIRKTGCYCQPVGDDGFREQIERQHEVKLGQMKRGRQCVRENRRSSVSARKRQEKPVPGV